MNAGCKALRNLIVWAFLACLTFAPGVSLAAPGDPVKVAVAGPMSGKNKSKGEAMVLGLSMYIDKANQEGGINGRRIELVPFDDGDDKETAIEAAKKIVASDVVAVFGHRNSQTSIAASPIYREAHVPIITGTATADEVTLNNPWYFRVVPNNAQQGRLIAYYLKDALSVTDVSIIYDKDEYGMSLLKSFSETSQEIGIRVQRTWGFQLKQDDLNARIAVIVDELERKNPGGTIFLAVHDTEAVPIIQAIRDRGLKPIMISGASVGKQSFPMSFNDIPLEKKSPGFYTDGIYATTYFIYDLANEKAKRFKNAFVERYNEEPAADIVSSFDVAGVAVAAMREAAITGADLTKDRAAIREALAGFNSIDKYFDGITGAIFFDAEGDAVKFVPMGRFENQRLISASVQLEPVMNVKVIENIRAQQHSSGVLPPDIVDMAGTLLRKKMVAYTGAEIINVRDLDFTTLTFKMDFILWLRYLGDLDVSKIEFTNAVGVPEVMVEEDKRFGKNHYQRLWVSGTFKMDFFPGSSGYRYHTLGVSLVHRDLDENRLIFVDDTLSVGETSSSGGLLANLTGKSALDHILNPSLGWSAVSSLAFQDRIEQNPLGDPDYVLSNISRVGHSRFTTAMGIRQNVLTLRGRLPSSLALVLSVGCVILIALFTWMGGMGGVGGFSTKAHRNTAIIDLLFLGNVALAGLLTLALESALQGWVRTFTGTLTMELLNKIFDVLWWLVPAFFVTRGVEIFLWQPLERSTGRVVPALLRSFTAFLIYLLAIFGVIGFVFDQKLTSLLATSGVIVMIIGLAIQINISNIFSGIAINMETPFRIGDWVRIGTIITGKVVDMTWRSTRVLTGDNNILSIPNAMVAEHPIENYNYPSDTYSLLHVVHLDAGANPIRAQKVLLDAMLSVEGSLLDPQPLARFKGIGDWSAEYSLDLSVRDYGKRFAFRQALWERIWAHLERAGIEPVFELTKVSIQRDTFEATKQTRSGRQQEEALLNQIAGSIQRLHLKKGEHILLEEQGGALMLVDDGVVLLEGRLNEAAPFEAGRAGAGQWFGPASQSLMASGFVLDRAVALADTDIIIVPLIIVPSQGAAAEGFAQIRAKVEEKLQQTLAKMAKAGDMAKEAPGERHRRAKDREQLTFKERLTLFLMGR